MTCFSMKSLFPTTYVFPSISPRTPLPGNAINPVTERSSRFSAAWTIAFATECSEKISREAAQQSASSSGIPTPVTDCNSCLPLVSVPVLSSTTVSIFFALSITSPPLSSIPLDAPKVVPVRMARGVASPRAQGQAITSTETAFMRATGGELLRNNHIIPVRRLRSRTAGTKYPTILSARACTGARRACASSMVLIICERTVSPPVFFTWNIRLP